MRSLLLFFLILPLYGVELLNYHIYDRKDRVDLMLSFDNTYKGKISQKKEKDFILLIFSDLTYSKAELKEFKSELVSKMSISSKDNNTYIMLESKQDIDLELSSINDKFGIRIRAIKQAKTNTNSNPTQTLPSAQTLKSKPQANSASLQAYTDYILVLSVLVFLLLVLWWFRTRHKNKGAVRTFKIIFQSFLDKNNQLVVFDYAHKRYTMIIGSSNILLESSEKLKEQVLKRSKGEDFDSFLQADEERIKTLIQEHQKS